MSFAQFSQHPHPGLRYATTAGSAVPANSNWASGGSEAARQGEQDVPAVDSCSQRLILPR